MKPATRVFRATLERIDSPLHWVMIQVPFDAAKVWGRGRLKVKGEINGFAIRTTLFPDGKGGHRLLVNKEMQRGAEVAPGMTAKFRLERDSGPRIVAVPSELARALSEERSLRRWFDGLSPAMRNEICKWVLQPKNSEARRRRAEQIAGRLLETKEAERELPPALEAALARNSLAREGWRLMSTVRRRRQLLGVFYYRSPDARARRIDKLMDEAANVARRKNERAGPWQERS
jgi:uncharacterized protein YdeI (YjbR/CyaY-like superfamily)